MTIDERQNAPAVLAPAPAPSGSREWLSDALRHACRCACNDIPTRPAQGRAAYVVGYLLSESTLSQAEADALLGSVT